MVSALINRLTSKSMFWILSLADDLLILQWFFFSEHLGCRTVSINSYNDFQRYVIGQS